MRELERITGKLNAREEVALEWQAIAPRIIDQAKQETSRKTVELSLTHSNTEGKYLNL